MCAGTKFNEPQYREPRSSSSFLYFLALTHYKICDKTFPISTFFNKKIVAPEFFSKYKQHKNFFYESLVTYVSAL